MKQYESFSNKEEEMADIEWRRRENFSAKRGREGEEKTLGAGMRREELTQFECHLCGEGSVLDYFQMCLMVIQTKSTQIFKDIYSGPKYSFRSLPHQAQAPAPRVTWLPVCGPLPSICQIGGVLTFASSCFYRTRVRSLFTLVSN